MKSVRESFVLHFSEEAALLLEAAAESHKNGIHDEKGSDPFKWTIAMVIGNQCIEGEKQKYHGLEEFNDRKFKQWVKDYGELGSHDGDVDYLSAFCGIYDEYIKEDERNGNLEFPKPQGEPRND